MARTDWAALVTEPAQEYQIRTELERFGLHPYLPQLRRRHHAGHHAFVLRHYPLFPRYLLLPYNQALDPRIRLITHIHRTNAHPTGVLTNADGRPWRCPAEAIQEIRCAEIEGHFDEVKIEGTAVTFTAPHLTNLRATLTRVINPSTVAVFTPLFGGSKAIVKSARLGHKQQPPSEQRENPDEVSGQGRPDPA